MSRLPIAVLAAAAVLTAPAAPAHAASSPTLRVHAIFAGDPKPGPFYAGQPIMATVVGRGRAKVTRICWNRTPIETGRCARQAVAFSPGRATVKATLSTGVTLKRTVTLRDAPTRTPQSIDESTPPALYYEVTCATPLYANFDDGALRGTLTTLAAGSHVAVYYRAGEDVLQVWGYAATKAGFAKDDCLQPAAAELNGG